MLPPTKDEVKQAGDGDGDGDVDQPQEVETETSVVAAVVTTTISHPPPPSAEDVAQAAATLQAAFEQPMQPPKGKRKNRDIVDVPAGEPKCYECGKKFGTWKGVFGHMRIHTDRTFRGAFPPPVGTNWTPSSSSVAASDLKRPQQQQPKLGFDIDLNAIPNIDDSDESDDDDDLAGSKRVRIIDLNKHDEPIQDAMIKKKDNDKGNQETKDQEEEKGGDSERDQ